MCRGYDPKHTEPCGSRHARYNEICHSVKMDKINEKRKKGEKRNICFETGSDASFICITYFTDKYRNNCKYRIDRFEQTV